MRSAVLLAGFVGLSASVIAQQAPPAGHHPVPPGQPTAHHGVMGFDPTKAVHHFYLHDDGGTIDVASKAGKDTTTLDAIRLHLQKAALNFGEGDFAMPHAVHAQPSSTSSAEHVMFQARQHATGHQAVGPVTSMFVPGTATMSRLKSDIKYTYAATDSGGRVEIVTNNAQAVQAVHEFLRFQITEHRTGDMDAIVRRTYQTRKP